MRFSNFRNWIHTLKSGHRSKSRSISRPLRTSFCLEQLDDRITPSAVTWTGGGDGTTWSDPNNWLNFAVPGAGDDVTIKSGTVIFSGTDTVNSLTVSGGTLETSGTLTTIQGLTLSSTIDNTGTLTVGGAFTWTNGTLDGTGTTILNGPSSLSGGFFSMLTDQQVDNNGSATITDTNSFDIRNNAVWNNEAGSTLTLQGSGSIGNFFASASAAINNSGTVDVSAGSETASIAVPFNNSGIVDVQSGTLSLTGGGTGGGTFTLDAAGSVFSPGNYSLQDATISGLGTVNGSNTLTVASASSISNLSLNGGTLTNTSALTINGTLTWTGGTINGTGDTTLDGTSSASGNSSFTLDGQVDNYGTFTIADGETVYVSGSTVWNNEATGTLILQGSGSFSSDSSAALNNSGTVEVAAGSETATIGIPFNNSGTVDVQTGTLQLNGGGSGGGTFTLDAAGATFSPGNYTLQDATVSGPGSIAVSTFNTLTESGASTISNLIISGGNLTLDDTLSVQNLTLSGGTLTDSSILTVNGTLTWSGGTLAGSGTTVLNGTSSVSGGSINGQQVNNFGTFTVADGKTLGFSGTSVWDNEASGTLILQGSGSLGSDSSANFNNSGTVDVVAGSEIASIGLPFNNSGIVDVQSGTLHLNTGLGGGTFTLDAAGSVLSSSNYTLQGATVSGLGTISVSLFNSLTVASTSSVSNLTVNGGTLTLNGALSVQNLTFSGGGISNNAALTAQNLTISSGTLTDSSSLTVNGTLTWSGGTIKGTGTTTLNGTSSVDGSSVTLNGQQVNNYGTFTIADGITNNVSGSAVWNNESTGTLILQGSGSFGSDSSATFNNNGAVDVVAGSETAKIGISFNNSGIANDIGTVDVQTGTFQLYGGGTGGGTFTIDAAAAVFETGNYTLQGATISGPGTVSVTTFNTVTVTAPTTITNLNVAGGGVDINANLEAQNLTFTSGKLRNPSSTLTVDNNLTWTSGGLQGAGTTVLNGTSAMSGGAFGVLTDQQVDNYGTATIPTGSSFDLAGSAVWNNEGSGTFILQGSLGGSSTNAFNNSGTLDISSLGTATIGVPFNNSGTVDVQSGTFSLGDQGVGGGTFTIESGATFTPNTYTLQDATVNGAGTLSVDGLFNPLTVAAATTVTNLLINGGSLDINSTLEVQNLTSNSSFSNITNIGTLTVDNTFTWTVGTLSGVGTTVLNGTSNLNGGFFSMFTDQQVDNYGTTTINDTNSIDFRSNAVWNNEASGTLILQGSGNIHNAATTAVFNNAGLIQVDAGTETAAIAILVNNIGTIKIDSGTLSLTAGFTNTGTITVAPGAALTPDPTAVTLGSGFTTTGFGQSVVLTATIVPEYPGVGRPTGFVSFYDGTTWLGGNFLPATGPLQVSIKSTSLAVGTHNITAVYGGDSNYVTSTSAGNSEDILPPGATVIGNSLYLVGANTTDSVLVKPIGRSLTGSTGLTVTGVLDNIKLAKTYAQPFSAVYVFDGGGNDSVALAGTLTVNAYITAGNGIDHITTAAGNDIITLGSGSDTVLGGNGNKTVTTQDVAGKIDIVHLGVGTNVVTLGAGNDQVVLGTGNHTVTALNGNDSVATGNGNNNITLGNGVNVVHTGIGTDAITVGNGKTTIVTSTGNKTITGGSGNDAVTAGTGTDVVALGGGHDTVVLGNGNNTVTLGDGTDYVAAGIGSNTITVGNGLDDAVHVGAGNNVIVTGNGNGDVVTAGNGDNLVAAGTGLHSVALGTGKNILIDGSVTLTQQGNTLGTVLAEWIANGNATSNVTNIRSQLQVTDNTTHINHLTTIGTNLDWFWYTDTQDKTTMTKTDLQN